MDELPVEREMLRDMSKVSGDEGIGVQAVERC
jgi:hypothetical protein